MNSSTERRIVIVGAGPQSWYRLNSLLGLQDEGLVVAGIVDVERSRAQKRADQFGIPTVYRTYEEVLADPSVDGVMIITPHHTHAELAVRAMDAGKHVFCEKPMALLLGDCERMVSAAELNRIKLAIGYQYWYWTKWLAGILAAGEIGRLRGARIWWKRSDHIPERGFSRDPEHGGVTFDLVGHLVAAIKSAGIVSQFDSITATARGESGQAPHTVSAMCLARGGVVVQIDASWADHGPADDEIKLLVYGDRGEVEVPFPGGRSDVSALLPVVRKFNDHSVFGPPPGVYGDIAAAQARNWLRAMRGEEQLSLTPALALEIEHDVHAIAEAARTGQPTSPGAIS